MTERIGHFIDGEYREPSGGQYFESTNPATLEVLYEAARGNEEDVRIAVDAARRTFDSTAWQRTTPTQRGHLLRRLGDAVAANAEELARFESLDNGKLLREMRGQLKSLPEYLYYWLITKQGVAVS
uniref:aldehyde dehydrogenase family protein n=1 Tax=Kocuria marina TaxID=223184 RepID=UPI0022E54730